MARRSIRSAHRYYRGSSSPSFNSGFCWGRPGTDYPLGSSAAWSALACRSVAPRPFHLGPQRIVRSSIVPAPRIKTCVDLNPARPSGTTIDLLNHKIQSHMVGENVLRRPGLRNRRVPIRNCDPADHRANEPTLLHLSNLARPTTWGAISVLPPSARACEGSVIRITGHKRSRQGKSPAATFVLV